jgi:SAM-dependent methyltransferase
MTDPRWWDIYANQEYMTPGVEETLALAGAICPPGEESLVLDIASGKGEAACQIAAKFGSRVVGVDIHARPDYARDKARARGLERLVSFVRGDGGILPFTSSAVDIGLCTGAPSIVGAKRCLAEMHRVLKPGGWAVVSDWVWRRRPVPPEAVPRSWPASGGFVLLEEYAANLREAGFEVVLAQALPDKVWDDYYRPMLEAGIERDEPRTFYEQGGREYWAYAVFIGRKQGSPPRLS